VEVFSFSTVPYFVYFSTEASFIFISHQIVTSPGCIAIGAMFFIFFLVPETKGKSLEEIEEMFFGGGTSHVQLKH